MHLSKIEKESMLFSEKLENKLKIKIITDDWGIERIIEVPEPAFTITFSLYNFFTVDIEYCNGIFEWNICNNDNLVSLNNHKKYNAETELDIFVKELLEILESRIPVKYLEYYKEKGFYTWKTFMDEA